MAYTQTRRMIDQRRKKESEYRDMDSVIAENKKQFQIANFEITTCMKIDRQKEINEAYKSKLKNDAKLLSRRQTLAALYNDEMESWKMEALSKVESQEDRKKRIMEKAYELREARQKDKERLIEDCYDRQWRDACDDARTLDSVALTTFMNNQRLQQIEEKMSQKQRLSDEENSFLTQWRQQLAEMEAIEIQNQQNRKQAQVATKEQVKEQILTKNQRNQDEFIQRREFENRTLAEVREKMKQDEENIKRKQEKEFLRGRKTAEFNLAHRQVLEQQQLQQKRQDDILLKYALQREKATIEAEDAKRRATRDAGKQFEHYLEEQMIREAEDSAFVDEACKREEERVWKARDDALQARDDARKQLMTTVEIGRQEQIRQKAEKLLREKYEGVEFAQQFIHNAKEALEMEKLEKEKRRQLNMDNQILLKEHIQIQREREEFERQQVYLQNKEMEYMEKLHKEKLQNQGGMVRLKYPIKSGQPW